MQCSMSGFCCTKWVSFNPKQRYSNTSLYAGAYATADLVLLDDDRANVDAVRSAGWIAQQVRRPQEARAALVHLGVLPSSR